MSAPVERRGVPRRSLIALVAVLVLGGCLGGPPTPGAQVTPPPNTDCPAVLTVEEAGAEGGEVIDYANRSATRQQEFDRALTRGEYELGDSVPETWSEPRIVEYEGTEYAASVYVC